MRNVHLLYMFTVSASAPVNSSSAQVLEGAYTSKAKAEAALDRVMNGAKAPLAERSIVLAGGNVMHYTMMKCRGEEDKLLYMFIETVTVE